ncbi:DUF3311 domain-containing protein [Ralstonia wenshanensis]|uniref:DUF3311 domain-containing protein n=1 Tax=Ralstonia wenshanensis TaxID=2842456 RepID=UPI003D975528
MVHHAMPKKGSRCWLWLLMLPWLATLCVPAYNRADPTLFGFPFFYWYQFLWVLITTVITAIVHAKTPSDDGNGEMQ